MSSNLKTLTEQELLNNRLLFGKIDSKQNVVYLSETNLKPLQTNNKTLFAVDFVVDAFTDLQSYFQKAVLTKKIDLENSEITSLEPNKAWESVHKQFYNTMIYLYELMVSLKLTNSSVANFTDFMEAAYDVFANLGGNVPLSLSSFISSKYCSPRVSGLMIDIGKKDFNNKEQIEDFVNDVNFPFYEQSAKRYGFFTNKQTPWRLQANIASPIMQEYMLGYGLNVTKLGLEELFDNYYYKAYESDIDIFKNYMLQFYNNFVRAYPYVDTI